jgi:hypothetical protein
MSVVRELQTCFGVAVRLLRSLLLGESLNQLHSPLHQTYLLLQKSKSDQYYHLQTIHLQSQEQPVDRIHPLQTLLPVSFPIIVDYMDGGRVFNCTYRYFAVAAAVVAVRILLLHQTVLHLAEVVAAVDYFDPMMRYLQTWRFTPGIGIIARWLR